ncbi:hypothetical protein LZK98_14360 [Sphingomonas cannabina]|uniref:hypothetical protein n=1 Tax=Sphingomonas cannabina TaxID=2899123 RepID=UPI001F201767|nr:hypothetical protein [Sphingomonas cannabina]UIJ44248.1 hypothetical protein LZK98_14360 [Sphingomonas cannabina]
MRLISKALLAGLGTLAFAGAAIAAEREHVINLTLPDGSQQQIRYSGDVAPQVVVLPVHALPAPVAWFGGDPFGSFSAFDRIAAAMDRQVDVMLRQAAELSASAPEDAAPMTRMAAGKLPAGSYSYSFVSTSTGSGTCSRSFEMTSYGPNQAPKVVSHSSGDCGGGVPAPRQAVAPAETPKPASNTI